MSDWLTALARLVASNMTPQEAGERLRAYTPELVKAFDSRDFDASSREFVARNCRFFPSYGELCDLLDKRPRPASEPKHSVENDNLSVNDCSWVAFWHERRAQLFALQTGFKWGSRERDLENLESLVRGQSPRAWAHVSGEPLCVPREPTEAEIAYVANLLRPKPAFQQSHAPEPEAPPRPKPHVPSGRVLAHMREARGCPA